MTSSPPEPAPGPVPVPAPEPSAVPSAEPRGRTPRRASRPADGPVLPDQTGDDLDLGWGDRPVDPRDDDERFLRERPPHWQ